MKVHLPGHHGYPACGSKVPGKKVPEPASLEDVTCGACKRTITFESREHQAGFEKIQAARAEAAENPEAHVECALVRAEETKEN